MVISTKRPDRTGRLLNGVLETFNLDEVIDWLQNEAEYSNKGHNALTLVKDYPEQDPIYHENEANNTKSEKGTTARMPLKKPTISTVVVCIQKDQRLHEHHTPGPFTLTMLRGRVNFILEPHGENVSTEIGQGQLLVLEEPRLHEVIALEDSAFLG
jgi:quercetin dioxygenase-like cupin family protein